MQDCDFSVFTPDNPFRAMIDWTLVEMGDLGLHAEVLCYHTLLVQGAELLMQDSHIERVIIEQQHQLERCCQCLWKAQAAMHITLLLVSDRWELHWPPPPQENSPPLQFVALQALRDALDSTSHLRGGASSDDNDTEEQHNRQTNRNHGR